MKIVIDIIMWTIIASILVLVVMNAKAVSAIITKIGAGWITETSMFTGAGYKGASGAAYG